MRFTLPVAAFAASFGAETALAAPAVSGPVSPALSWTLGIVGLAVATVLLVYVFALAKVAEGSAIAENITFVAAAVVCIAGAVVASWAARFLPAGLSAEQAGLASDGLIIVGMVLLTVYLARVRRALLRFVRAATEAQELLAKAHSEEPADEPDSKTPAAEEGMSA
jgi:hypothetical protein